MGLYHGTSNISTIVIVLTFANTARIIVDKYRVLIEEGLWWFQISSVCTYKLHVMLVQKINTVYNWKPYKVFDPRLIIDMCPSAYHS
jgi:hypothetical protein